MRRKHRNVLFGAPDISDEAITQAQRKDRQEARDFLQDFEQLVMEVAGLDGTVDTEVILDLKTRLDKAYEKSSTLAGEQAQLQDAIRKLLAVIMGAVWDGAGNDVQAQQELEQEELARRTHFGLLEFQIVGDMLDPDSPIGTDELIATLLSEPESAFEAAMQLFDDEQKHQLSEEGFRLLERVNQSGHASTPEAWARVKTIAAGGSSDKRDN